MVMADGPPNCGASICTVQSAKNHSDNKNKDGHCQLVKVLNATFWVRKIHRLVNKNAGIH